MANSSRTQRNKAPKQSSTKTNKATAVAKNPTRKSATAQEKAKTKEKKPVARKTPTAIPKEKKRAVGRSATDTQLTHERNKRLTALPHIIENSTLSVAADSTALVSDLSSHKVVFTNFKAAFMAITGRPFAIRKLSWNEQVSCCDHLASVASLTLCTIADNTLSTYGSAYRTIGRAINDLTPENRLKLRVTIVEEKLFTTKHALPLLCAVIGYVVTEEFWVQFLHFRMVSGLPHLGALRSALLKAQQAAHVEEWAGLQCHIEWAKAASVVAWENKEALPGVGAITTDMLNDLVNYIDEAEEPLLGLVLQIEFFGCFRIGEVLEMKVDKLREDGVWLFNPKQVRRTDAKKWVFKPLAKWAGGRTALHLLRTLVARNPESSNNDVIPHHITARRINEVIEKASRELEWGNLVFRSHGLRHGGIQRLIAEEGRNTPFPDLCNWLLMSEPMVRMYATPNELREKFDPKGKPADDFDDSFSATASNEEVAHHTPWKVARENTQTSPSPLGALHDYLSGVPSRSRAWKDSNPEAVWRAISKSKDKVVPLIEVEQLSTTPCFSQLSSDLEIMKNNRVIRLLSAATMGNH